MGRRLAETERTYATGPHTGLPDLTGLTPAVRSLPLLRLHAVYYDTAGLTLAAHHVTLRRREGGDDDGWHLKLPTDRPDTRTEVHAPLDAPGAPPEELRAEIAALVRGRILTPLIRLHTVRRRLLLLDGTGRALAEVAHDEVDARPGPSWSEIEVELRDGDERLLEAVGQRLAEAGIVRAEMPSKLAHALGPRLPRAPQRQAPPGPGATAGEAVLGSLRDRLDEMTALDPAVRRAEENAVHRMRVATRKARSALKSFRRVLDRAAADPLAAELKWLAAVLGEERDREVLAARLGTRLARLDAGEEGEAAVAPGSVTAARARFAEEGHARAHGAARTGEDAAPTGGPGRGGGPQQGHAAPAGTGGMAGAGGTAATAGTGTAYATVRRALDSARYFALLDAFDALLADPPARPAAARPAADVLAHCVRRDRRRLRRAVRAALDQPPGHGQDLALHQARKAAKRARYSAEAAAPVLGERAAEHAERTRSVQKLLGRHQDSVMCRQAVAWTRERAVAAGEDPTPYDVIAVVERRSAERVRAKLPKTWHKADRKLKL